MSGYDAAVSEPRSGEAPPRLCEFPPVGRDAWERRALRELAGAPLEVLRRRTRHGVTLEALYCGDEIGQISQEQRAALDRSPGEAPFLRGAQAGEHRWRIRQTIDATSVSAANADARADLQNGADSLWFRLDERIQAGDRRPGAPGPIRPGVVVRDLGELEALLDGIDLAGDLVIEAGVAALPISAGVLTLAERRGLDPRALRLTIGGDPISAFALRGHLGGGLDRAYEDLAASLRSLAETAPHARTVLATAVPYADAGAGASEEIALLLCTIIDHVRRLGRLGIGVDLIAPRLLAALSVDRDLFVGIAKVRAARLLAARTLLACGASTENASVPLHLEGSWRELSAFDPWVNLLRGTTSAFVGATAGAQSIATPAFTDALGRADGDARRMASNTQLLLREECHLGRVADPAGGSWYVESLTESLARAAWERVQAIEAAGGIAAELRRGALQAHLAEASSSAAADVARARSPITGVNRYAINGEGTPSFLRRTLVSPPDKTEVPPLPLAERSVGAIADALGEGVTFAALVDASATDDAPALVRERLAAPFEALRAAGAASIPVLCVGALAAIKPRIDFTQALLASGGIVAEGADTLFDGADAAAASFAHATSRAAVIVATEDDYPVLLPRLIPELQRTGAEVIAIAGGPKDEAARAALVAAGVDLFLARGGEALSALRRLRATLTREAGR